MERKSECDLISHIYVFPAKTGLQAGTCCGDCSQQPMGLNVRYARPPPDANANANDDSLITVVEDFWQPPSPTTVDFTNRTEMKERKTRKLKNKMIMTMFLEFGHIKGCRFIPVMELNGRLVFTFYLLIQKYF